MKTRLASIALPLAVSFAACDAPTRTQDDSFETVASPIVNGTREPEAVALTDGQILAIGWLHRAGRPGANFCTGTVIAPRVVATASHCTEGSSASDIGFGIGLDPSNPVASFTVVDLHEHPSVDAALLVLGSDVVAEVPEVEPIPANTTALGNGDVGQALQAGGYGETYDRSRTGRWFATVYLEQVGQTQIQVDGRGVQGICYGDSGGPVIRLDADGQPVVLGVESYGDSSCVDNDVLTRLDAIYDWITPVLGGDAPWDPCNGLDFLGQCNGNVAEWCQDGQLRQRDCTALGTTCSYVSDQVGYICDCGDEVDFYGRCDGNTVEYCDEGRFARINCEAMGQVCGLLSEEQGYYCVDEAACSAEDAAGRCDGNAAVNCSDGFITRDECDLDGRVCTVGDDGAYCAGGGADAGTDSGGVDAGVADIAFDDADSDTGVVTIGGGGGGGSRSGCAVGGSIPTPLPLFALLGLAALRRRR